MTDRLPTGTETREIAARLLEVLAEEHRALAANEIETLEQSVKAKQELVAAINAAAGRAAPAIDAELKTLLQQCRHQNEVNGAIVAARLHLTELSLAILRGDAQSALYGPHGGTAGGSGSGRSIARA
jgi:flagellar biosynthesis/type III secretory pathway chaperone